MANVLTIALNPAVDFSSRTQTVRPTRKTRVSGMRCDPGGGGINVARVISRLGGEAETLVLAGGEIGAILGRLIREEGIACHAMAIAGQTRIGFTVFEESTGLEYRFVPEGPAIGENELEPCLDLIDTHEAGFVVASGSLPAGVPDDTYATMAERAAARGAKFVLDTSGIGLKTVLEKTRVYLVKPSRGELEQYVGRRLDEEGIRQAAVAIVERGAAELVAVTMGDDGALLASTAGVLRLPAVHVRVRSAVGAGDSFLGAMIWALAEGRETERAFRLGVAAGAAAVMTPGTELCRREDVLSLAQRVG
ncbi:1-phosphofructokinase family hexose kinase [Nitratireductor sp. ZSWI3]|uniref:1-phosphofructokinase family hexose kinase n=1 Tax=Nitratireductor sp. ZSWI3 TaxID=2966359 RepID=UPI00214F61DE|nr:1-phosphofructokinase family hexose kinase [Nitratireductor sp. ZSWI3]MCR4264611.1 1-phosphofructokinase family hexose kinase [Nitratireductor sp. ZSWI3]